MNQDNHENMRLVIAVNKRLESGVAMNAVFHLGAGLVNLIGDGGRETLKFLDFEDGDGQIHRSISARSFIVLRASSSEIRKLREQAQESGVTFADFLATMTGDTYREQLDRTRQTAGDALEYYGIALYGDKETLAPLTRKLSLWR